MLAIDAAGVTSQQSFLASFSKVLVPVLLLEGADRDFSELASKLEMEPKKVLAKHVDSIFGMVYPYSEAGGSQNKEIASRVLRSGIILKYIPGMSATGWQVLQI